MTMNKYKDKTLLIIGGSTEAVPIIKIAKEFALRVVVSDGDADAPGFDEADETIVADLDNIVESAEGALRSSANIRIDGVMSAAADVPYTVAYVAKELGGLPSIGVESAKYAMDKLLMKGLFKDAGVPTARFSSIESLDHLERVLDEIDTPVVIKPTDGRGARGVVRLLKGVERRWAYEEAINASPSRTCMIEEWIDGPRISTESVITKDNIATPIISDRNYDRLDEFSPYVIEDGGDLPADITEAEQTQIEKVIMAAAETLGISEAVIRADIVLGPDGPLVIEVAHGLGHSLLSIHAGLLSSGANIVEAAVGFALGLDVEAKDYRSAIDKYFCERFLFPGAGTVKELRVDERLKDDKRVAFLNLPIKPGDKIEKVSGQPLRAGSVITIGESTEEARVAVTEALAGIQIVIDEEIE